MNITFPWPDKRLSPNARLHRLKRAQLVREARRAAYYITRAVIEPGKVWPKGLHIKIEFCPPDNRRRDLDNMLASNKATLDGLSDALGVDDSNWTLTLERGAVIIGGAVNITIERNEE
jgi:crossover junction endodeoxyribonuclease RusA